ncbi:MAG: 50S ribosomal protein L29 [bacterium]|nr:50S ribosomal protein L29 [bacterium]MDZ4231844.1 50S ribosomal protein L29 [Candidatus Pacearchaeota archaeon]
MKPGEIRQKSQDQSEQELRSLREKLNSMKFDMAAGKVKNIDDLRRTKRDIARILTILREK